MIRNRNPFPNLPTLAVGVIFSVGFYFSVLAVVYAHHGWAEFDQEKEITLTGTVIERAFEYPHTTMKLKIDEGTEWNIQMAPPRRANRIGVTEETLVEGITVTVTGHPHREIENMMRIVEITIDEETYTVR